MTVFTDEQMHRPLFEEPTEELERPNEWSEPLGFMVGGMANQEYQYLGQQYFDAACHLVNCIKNRDVADCDVANPVLYLYRHSIELFLKAILQDAAKTHSLDTLAEEYRAFVKEVSGADCPEWIVTRMKELGTVDPKSTAFRYSMNYDRRTRRDQPVEGEFHVDLHHLESAMTALNIALAGTIAPVACGGTFAR